MSDTYITRVFNKDEICNKIYNTYHDRILAGKLEICDDNKVGLISDVVGDCKSYDLDQFDTYFVLKKLYDPYCKQNVNDLKFETCDATFRRIINQMYNIAPKKETTPVKSVKNDYIPKHSGDLQEDLKKKFNKLIDDYFRKDIVESICNDFKSGKEADGNDYSLSKYIKECTGLTNVCTDLTNFMKTNETNVKTSKDVIKNKDTIKERVAEIKRILKDLKDAIAATEEKYANENNDKKCCCHCQDEQIEAQDEEIEDSSITFANGKIKVTTTPGGAVIFEIH